MRTYDIDQCIVPDIRIALDPNIKDVYCRVRWEPDQYAAGMRRMEEVVRVDILLHLLRN